MTGGPLSAGTHTQPHLCQFHRIPQQRPQQLPLQLAVTCSTIPVAHLQSHMPPHTLSLQVLLA